MSFFCRCFEHVLVCLEILRNNKLAGNLKEICLNSRLYIKNLKLDEKGYYSKDINLKAVVHSF